MENLIECKISREDLKILHKKLCVYENGIEDKKDLEDSNSIFCDKCILRNIEWSPCMADVYKNDWFGNSYVSHKKPIIRDLCFAIWHDAILTDNPKHYHHNF